MKAPHLPILIAFVLLLASSKPPGVQSHKPTADNRSHADQGHPPQMTESPLGTQILEALRAIVRQQQTARAEDQANEERWWPPTPSWAIVYVTVVYVVVAIFQWGAIRRQANIANATLIETRKAANAAMLSAKTTREAQRGYIFAGPISPIQNFAIGQEPLIWMGLKNVGPTRIYDCVSETWVEVLKKPFIDFSNSAHYQRKEDRFALYPNAPIAPGASYLVLMRWNEPLSEQQFRDIQADRWALCIRARFQYRDAFGEPVTQNCAFSSNSVTWETLPKYND